MKFVLANWGSRGEVEPCAAVGRELLQRGHEVRLAVAPDLVDFVESAGLEAVGYGPDLQAIVDPYRDFWTLLRKFWRIRDLIRLLREIGEPIAECREEISRTLTSLTSEADLLITGMNYEDTAVNVAEYHNLPLATLHWFPLRTNSQLLPLPASLCRFVMTAFWWFSWRGIKKFEDEQRREFRLPKATGPWPQR